MLRRLQGATPFAATFGRTMLGAGSAFVIASCAGDGPGAAETRSVRDSAGVEIVTFHASAPGEPILTLESDPITTIGRDSADRNQQFRGIPLPVRLADGDVVVTEQGAISRFDSAGAFVKTLARRGRGPGELERVLRMIVIPGDTLVVRQSNKVLKYAPDLGGLLVSEERLDCSGARKLWEGSIYCAPDFFADGSALTIADDSTIPLTATNRPDRRLSNGGTSPGPGHLRQLYRVYFIPAMGDTAYPLGLSSGIEQYGIAHTPTRTIFVIHPFYSRRSFAASNASPRRVAIALNPEYNVEVWNDGGRLIRLIRRTNARPVPTDAEHAEVRGTIERQLEGEPITVDRALAEMDVPDSLPAIAGLIVGAGGEVVVQTSGWRVADTISLVDVFDDRGVWVAQWKLPRRVRLFELGWDYLLTGRLDEDDIPLVEVWRVRRQGGGFGTSSPR